ncbi:MAG: class I SAM-dependent methyltransferase [Chloroflexi bacterium]|jgi:tellurite methyltransferase|nr:class I SAM-dependent methyltransferase [Chloroflexota bacterium]MBT7080600.1 class I SAM-dependent methyltransferase [Chloroflexota bacterium]
MQGNERGPSAFLVENIGILPKGRAFDVAMGDGRNAVYLAKAGYDVHGVDISAEAVEAALSLAVNVGVDINAEVGDLENGYRIEENAYDLIVCFNYLHRPLIPQIRAGLKTGGFVVYETFIVDQAGFGRPSNPDHLLEHNELLKMFGDFRCLCYHEGVFPGPKAVASIVAQKGA